VPKVNFNFVSIADLERVEKEAIIDVLGVVKEVGELDQITSVKTSKPHSKREISIVDSSNSWVRCTVWGKNAETWDIAPDSVVAFKSVKVSGFGGRSLSMLFSSSMMTNPDIDEAHNLKGWYDGQGQRELSTYSSHAGLATTLGGAQGRKESYKTLQQVADENLGTSDEPDYFNCKATIVYIKHDNVSYPACLSEGCNKKVLRIDDDSWRCEKCSITHPKPHYRYALSSPSYRNCP
jgi:replication factor A1